ncbi:ABC transporter permease [Aliifodinibius sp. S!AR15-10]|uniref:ABC transporter permease n=1 Tax=Aliifodinibius sp. S!AR15-10 TaxID=2950437 RepID=UPI0028617908|nr:ABC transporter permease [Aliifodinibius sp. S!AR15-10]MDR8390125.1 ABC transporter permease [Aliifodinibius sp. S!AR15-10]
MSKFYRVANSVWESLKISFRALGTNKTRSILTATCIVIGIVSVTTMSTTIDGIDRAFEKSMSMLGQNVIYVEKWPWGLGSGEYKWWEYRNRRDMKIDYAEELEEGSRFASAVSASSMRNATVRFGDKYADGVILQGATEAITRTSSMDIAEGRFFTAEEERTGSNVVVMGQSVSDALFEFEYPLGKQVKIGGQRFLVIGLMERQGSFLGLEDLDNQVIIPMTAFQEIYGSRLDVRLTVKFPGKEAQLEGEYEIEGLMRSIRQLDPLEENDFAINKPEAFRQQYESMTFAIYGIGIFLTSLALFIGGIGVMNIMFVSVRERTKEIGIRKAVGAKAWEILAQFLVEATIICMIGGVIGVLLSIITTQIINQFFVAYMSWRTVALAFGICTLVGLAFGFLPAYRAAKSDPIDSLRYE